MLGYIISWPPETIRCCTSDVARFDPLRREGVARARISWLTVLPMSVSFGGPFDLSLLATDEKLELPNRRNPQLRTEQLKQKSEVSWRRREGGLPLGPWP
jgi:hypothetical protein